MTDYCLLPHPGTSAVFFSAVESLSLAELSLCLTRLETPCGNAGVKTWGGCRWYQFEAAAPLSQSDLSRIARLSSLYALFEQREGWLRPIDPGRSNPFPEDLSAILKYTGKTNSLFTRLMLHMAELSLPYAPKGRLKLLDPVAGKGTTLYEALMRGWDATGVEIVQRAAHEGAVYFQKYLETEKWRHKPIKEKAYGAQAWKFAFARDKDELKENPGLWTMIAGDAKNADKFFGKAAFDIVAGDLPYGVAHGSIAASGLARSPAALLTACLPAWRTVLRPSGVIALSWNVLVMPAADMVSMLESAGFSCLREGPYGEMSHRVDASIRRDIAIGVKKP